MDEARATIKTDGEIEPHATYVALGVELLVLWGDTEDVVEVPTNRNQCVVLWSNYKTKLCVEHAYNLQ